MGKPKPAYAVWSWGLDDKKQFQTALRDVKEAGFEYFESVSKTIRIFESDADEFMRAVEREGVYPASFYFPFSGDAGEDFKKIENSLGFLEKVGVKRISLQAPGKKGGEPRQLSWIIWGIF